MAKEIEVIYERGVFKPLKKVDFPESAKMRISLDEITRVLEIKSVQFY